MTAHLPWLRTRWQNIHHTTVIDVHRDSILTDDGRAYKTSCTINGEETAQLMLVVGTDDGGLYHPDWQENLNRAASLQYRLNRTYPDTHASA